jgi:hypothetical protein
MDADKAMSDQTTVKLSKLVEDVMNTADELDAGNSPLDMSFSLQRNVKGAERYEGAEAALKPRIETEESGSKEEAKKQEGDPDKSEDRHDDTAKEAMPLEAAEPALDPAVETAAAAAKEEADRMADQEHQSNEDVNDAKEETETKLDSTNETEAATDMSEGLGDTTDEYTNDKSDQSEAKDEHSAIETQRGSLKFYARNTAHNPVGLKAAAVSAIRRGNLKAAHGYIKLANHATKQAKLKESGRRKIAALLEDNPEFRQLSQAVRSAAGIAASKRAEKGRNAYVPAQEVVKTVV